jgi:hypothetical protein
MLFTSLNPAETERLRSESTVPSFEFMIVSETAPLAVPTPVVGKFTWAGTIWTFAPTGGSTPLPFRLTFCPALTMSEMVSVPLWAPAWVGVKTTLIEQLELAANFVVQLLDT